MEFAAAEAVQNGLAWQGAGVLGSTADGARVGFSEVLAALARWAWRTRRPRGVCGCFCQGDLEGTAIADKITCRFLFSLRACS